MTASLREANLGVEAVIMSGLVECRLCGHTAETLAKHFKAEHSLTCGEYRILYPDSPIRGGADPFTPKYSEKPRVRGKRGSRFEGLILDGDGKPILDKLVEGYHYVQCAICGGVAEDLTEHILLLHTDDLTEYSEAFPSKPVRCKRLDLISQTSLKGRKLSDEVKAKMSASAGWNRGLTKDTDARVANAAAAMKGRTPWNEGLTKEDHPSLQSTSTKLSQLRGPDRYWSNGLKADLSRVDFTPYIDETGAVDRKSMSESLGVSEVTITKYMESIGLRISTKYVDARVERDTQTGRFFEMSRKSAEQTTVRLTAEQLDPYKLKSGKVSLSKAIVGLGHVYQVVKRECDRLGIPTHTRLVKQSICLEAIAKVLGSVPFEQEWRATRFTNPYTGYRFRFDGYFPSHDLVVEFHGYQHYVFPSVYVQKEELFFALQERDRIKENLIHSDPTLRYFLVREDEPYADSEYLRGRLIDEGILDPGK